MRIPSGPRPSERRRPRYVDVVEDLVRQTSGALMPGTVGEIQVRHDGWCATLADRGPCDCNPTATLVHHGG